MDKKAIFLDRDGIINVDYGYVYKIEDFEFMPNIIELLNFFQNNHYKLFIVTNQSGIGRGYYTLNDFKKLTAWMIKILKKQSIIIEEVQFCPHAPEIKCKCRKPKTGMIEALVNTHHIDLEKSWMIGDKQSDIDLAHNAKIGQTIAIGNRVIKNSTYHFLTITECNTFFKANLKRLN